MPLIPILGEQRRMGPCEFKIKFDPVSTIVNSKINFCNSVFTFELRGAEAERPCFKGSKRSL